VAVFLAVVGSVVAGVGQTSMVLIIGEVLQGAGGGASTALSEVVISDLVPPEFRSRWLMVLNLVWSIGTAAGPIIGALLVDTSAWVGDRDETFKIEADI
jgi:MFS family permease